jgi:hypothetical protein
MNERTARFARKHTKYRFPYRHHRGKQWEISEISKWISGSAYFWLCKQIFTAKFHRSTVTNILPYTPICQAHCFLGLPQSISPKTKRENNQSQCIWESRSPKSLVLATCWRKMDFGFGNHGCTHKFLLPDTSTINNYMMELLIKNVMKIVRSLMEKFNERVWCFVAKTYYTYIYIEMVV